MDKGQEIQGVHNFIISAPLVSQIALLFLIFDLHLEPLN